MRPARGFPVLLFAVHLACSPAGGGLKTRAASLDRDLLEISVPRLQQLYATHTWTVTEVVSWHLARLERYDGVYRSVETLYRARALADAARLDAQAAQGQPRGPLFGVPIVVKANTSIEGEVTSDGWAGFIDPKHPLVATRDATVVARLRAAGAVILGHTNMPDFANSDTNRSTAFGRTGNAYDVRFSPGGSSGGTVTAVTANFAVLGTGTDTGNSIRMPAATSAVVGVFPTRGLVSLAGIAPLDWQLDNTGPIARSVEDAALALSVLAGEDPADPKTGGSEALAQRGPYARFLERDALRGKRFAVPAFILAGGNAPFHGLPAAVPEAVAEKKYRAAHLPLDPRTRAAFLRAIDELRAAGATVVLDETVLPESFIRLASRVATYPYVSDGFSRFLAGYAPRELATAADFERTTGRPLSEVLLGTEPTYAHFDSLVIPPALLATDPQADANLHRPRRELLAAYLEPLERLHLDGYVYPATQLPPPDETMPQDGAVSEGPHSATSWVNMLGVPAVVAVGPWYPEGLPFGLELSARPWRDGDLLGWAYAYEQATQHRRPPVLVEHGLLPSATGPLAPPPPVKVGDEQPGHPPQRP